MGTSKEHLRKKTLKDRKLIEDDPYLSKSKDFLRHSLYNQIKDVFVGSLNAIENKLGKSFPAYPQLRAEILRIGNDKIRDMHNLLDDHFNVEMVVDVEEFDNKNKRKR